MLRFVPLWALAAFIVATALLVTVVSPAEAPASPTRKSSGTPKPRHTPKIARDSLYAVGGCDASDVLASLYGKDKADQGAPAHLAWMISARVEACNDIITAWLSYQTPTPNPVIGPSVAAAYKLSPAPSLPPHHCTTIVSDDPMRQYSVLQTCVTWISKYVTAIGTPTPPPVTFRGDVPQRGQGQAWQKNVYVLALASDAPTSAQISYRLRDALTLRSDPPVDKFTNIPVQYNLIAEPTWQITNFQQQCFNDPSTAGAIVALPPSTQGNTFNIVLAWAWTVTAWQTVVLDCRPTNTAYINNAVYLAWADRVQSGKATSYSVPLASALGVLAGILALHPARQGTFAVVTPSPLPTTGTSYQTGYTVGSNNSLGTLAAIGIAALTPLSSTNLGQGTEADGQLAAAIANAVPKVAADLESPCPSASALQCNWLTKP